MPTDLTGTPTSLGIGTYNVDADAPSGLGFNAAMAQIDALIAARVAAPTGIASSEAAIWNGTTWVRSSGSSVRINNGGTTIPKITTSAFSGGPPGSPIDGDIWIAIEVEATNHTRWTFQWDATNSHWDFIGGAPVLLQDESSFAITSNTLGYTNRASYTVVRGGTYLIRGDFYGNVGAGGAGTMQLKYGKNNAAVFTAGQSSWPASAIFNIPGIRQPVSVVPTDLLQIGYGANQAGTGGVMGAEIVPAWVT